MFLGGSFLDSRFSILLGPLPDPLVLKEGALYPGGEKRLEEDESLLVTYPHPVSPGRWITLYTGMSTESLSRSHFIFYYGWDSYLLFKKGRPQAKGDFSPGPSPVTYDFLSHSFGKDLASRLRERVTFLTTPPLKERNPGTNGYRKVQEYLVQELLQIGIPPVHQPFSYPLKDIGQGEAQLGASGREIVEDLNIGGILEGQDPRRSQEFLILSIHYDHSPPGPDEGVNGISMVLEVAKALKEREKDLRRSVLFLFLGGEERGNRGSRTFIGRPFVPMHQVKAFFSLNSVGIPFVEMVNPDGMEIKKMDAGKDSFYRKGLPDATQETYLVIYQYLTAP
jgi:hypothetical protein